MSVIVEDANNKIWLYCKGADSILLERMDKAKNPEIDDTQRHLSVFADEGLRTLLICKKEIPRSEYDAWAKKYLVKTFIFIVDLLGSCYCHQGQTRKDGEHARSYRKGPKTYWSYCY